jgi:hypothetical protein
MSRAKLLRQYLHDYNRKVEKADDIYREQYGTYKAKAEEYNAFVNSVKAGQQQAVGEYAPGAYTLLKGYTDDQGQAGLTAAYADKKGNPQMAGALVDKLPEGNAAGLNGVYVKNPNGTATFHSWSGGGLFGNTVDEFGQEIPQGWQNTGYSARIMDNSGITAPEQHAPPAPRFTQNQIREMEHPTDDAAGIVKAQALGYSGNPQLKGLEPASRNSAFSNIGGDDPNNLKDKGVLARAIAGEI